MRACPPLPTSTIDPLRLRDREKESLGQAVVSDITRHRVLVYSPWHAYPFFSFYHRQLDTLLIRKLVSHVQF
jgi:hypothetical protein